MTDNTPRINMAPSWGNIGSMFYRLAVSKEVRAISAGHHEFAKAFALAEALSEVIGELTPEQIARVDTTYQREMRAQGIEQPDPL